MKENNSSIQDQMFQKIVMLNRYHTKDKVDLLYALKKRYGEEVFQIVEKVECEKAIMEWQHHAKQNADTSIESLICLLWEPLKEKGFEFTSEVKGNGIQMKCTRCPIYEMAKEMKATDLMYYHTCSTDECIASAFNPQIGFKRTKTLMQGDDYCDHYYYMK